MAVRGETRWFRQMLKAIDSYRVQDGKVLEDFISRYGLNLTGEETARPVIKGTSTSEVIREVREGRWQRYT